MNRESFISEELKPGKYIVWLYTPWVSFVRECVFSVYGPANTELRKLEEK
jgi:hypothetical protein